MEARTPDAVPALMDDDRLPAGALLCAGAVRLRLGSVVTSLSNSKDGKTIVTASWDTTVSLWDAATVNELRAFSVAQAPLHAAALSPDGKTLAGGAMPVLLKAVVAQLRNLVHGEALCTLDIKLW